MGTAQISSVDFEKLISLCFCQTHKRCVTQNQQANQAELVSEEAPQRLYHTLDFSDFKALGLK